MHVSTQGTQTRIAFDLPATGKCYGIIIEEAEIEAGKIHLFPFDEATDDSVWPSVTLDLLHGRRTYDVKVSEGAKEEEPMYFSSLADAIRNALHRCCQNQLPAGPEFFTKYGVADKIHAAFADQWSHLLQRAEPPLLRSRSEEFTLSN